MQVDSCNEEERNTEKTVWIIIFIYCCTKWQMNQQLYRFFVQPSQCLSNLFFAISFWLTGQVYIFNCFFLCFAKKNILCNLLVQMWHWHRKPDNSRSRLFIVFPSYICTYASILSNKSLTSDKVFEHQGLIINIFDLIILDSHIKTWCKLKFDKVSPKIEEIGKFKIEFTYFLAPLWKLW